MSLTEQNEIYDVIARRFRKYNDGRCVRSQQSAEHERLENAAALTEE